MADFPVPSATNGEEVAIPRRVPKQTLHTERPLKIITAGAGASGLCLAYKLQRSFEKFDLTIYEKNNDISGTWYENRYPGCACDVPSHNYTWSFEPSAHWSGVYSGSREIYQYFSDFADKYSLRKYIRLQHVVVGAKWDDDRAKWVVEIQDIVKNQSFFDECDIFINAGGILNAWRWPAIPGLESYKKPIIHSAAWDDSVDLRGKHIGLIGNGSSGIQILPAILPQVAKVTTFIREPTWVAPVRGLEQKIYSPDEKAQFKQDPSSLQEYRRIVERGLNGNFSIFIAESETNKATKDHMTRSMKEKLNNAKLEEQLIPQWSVGCRRLTPGIDYLESLGKSNVKTVYGEIDRITPNGCVCDDGNEYPVDVLICATGFDTTFKPRFPLIAHGRNLQDDWAQEPRGYFGVGAPDYPNYFMFLGPNCPIGNGPVLAAIEVQADYMLKIIDRWQTDSFKSFAPKKEAVDDFIDHKDRFMKGTVWDNECRSWYKGNNAFGKVTALWPGSTLHYIEAMADVRYDDYNIEYRKGSNRYDWLGNGFSQAQMDPTCDSAYYIRSEDDSPYLSKGKARKVITGSGTIDPSKAATFTFSGAKKVVEPAVTQARL